MVPEVFDTEQGNSNLGQDKSILEKNILATEITQDHLQKPLEV